MTATPSTQHDTTEPIANLVKQVAVGVLQNAAGQSLLAQRPPGTSHPGWWEYPGGKFEAGETLGAALIRELREELGIEVKTWRPWFVKRHVYPHTTVQLHFCRVSAWHGTVKGQEGQRIAWLDPSSAAPTPVLPATLPALKWLGLPEILGITQAGAIGIENFLARYDHALAHGLRWIQCREPELNLFETRRLFDALLTRRDHYNQALADPDNASLRCHVILNGRHPREWWSQADGVQLPAAMAHQLDERPPVSWLGVSAHNQDDIEQARRLDADWIVLGPVAPTLSHPAQPTLGWPGFAALAQQASQPQYAIGGMDLHTLELAQQHGAQGVAVMRGLTTVVGHSSGIPA